MDIKKIKGKYFEANSDKVFVFIHGYTGGPTDFGNLPEILHREFSATVSCPLLPGHGTSVDHLIGLNHQDLFNPIEQDIKHSAARGKKIVLIGLSMGAEAALYFASKYPVNGVVAIGINHYLKFPFNIPGLGILGLFKKTWDKKFTPAEIELRKSAICYNKMPVDGLYLSKKLRKLLNASAAQIYKPVMFIHSLRDRLCSPKAAEVLSRKIPGRTSRRIIDCKAHSMFFSDVKDEITREIIFFIKNEKIFDDNKPATTGTKITAIIPAYNEAPRINRVLTELMLVSSIDEVIVVDDSSQDETSDAVRKFEKVTLIHNEKNIGKGASLDKAVKIAKNDLLFFCDADLINFKARHAEAIIEPVLNGKYDMFIGIRGNFMQKTIRAWALNSGERALRKEIWQKLPAYYKHRYRVEVGLNHYVKNYTNRGFGAKVFDYVQPVKESKYGFVRGTILRWWMNFDVIKAYSGRFS